MQLNQTNLTETLARSRRLVLFAMLAIAAVLTTLTAEFPSDGLWELPGITLGAYVVALSLLLTAPPGVGCGFAITVSGLLAAGSALLSFQLWALAQGEVSTARDRQTVWMGAAACLANLSLLIAVARYLVAVRDRVRWWHVALGAGIAVPPMWILMSKLI